MNHALILCRSVTQAQRLGRLLASRGITSRIFRTPVGLTERGCSYTVRLREEDLNRAMLLIQGIRPVKILLQRQGGYEEVRGQ